MRLRGKGTLTLISALAVLILPNLAVGATYYVDHFGSNDAGANNCSVEATPCRTITHALTQVLLPGTAGDPHVIMVAAGLYDQAGNGEVYPITLTQDYVSLEGEDTATTFFDGATANALVVNAKGFSLSGFTFRNSGIALEVSQGGFTVSNNVFENTVGTGVYSSISNLLDNQNFTVDPISFTNNIFRCKTEGEGVYEGVEFEIGLGFDGMTPNLTAAIGDITFTGNTFTDCHSGIDFNELYIGNMVTGTAMVGNITVTDNTFTDGYRGIELNELYVESMTDSIVTWGDINFDGNRFTRIEYGIEFSGWFGSSGSGMVDTTINVGNVSVSNNTFTDNIATAIYVDYFNVSSLSGNSSAILGDLLVQNNTIDAGVSGDGIEINDIGYIEYIYDASMVTTGSVIISGNSVESSGHALYVYNEGVFDIGVDGGTDTVMVSFGPISIINNPKLSSTNSNGVYLDIEKFGYDQYGQTRVDVGLITVDNNTITSINDDGLYMYYYYGSGYSMGDEAQLDIAGLTFTNNDITSTDYSGVYIELYELGYDMNGNSRMTVGPAIISGNEIKASSEALYFYFYEVAYYMYDSSTFTMYPWTINNNILITADLADYGALTIYYNDSYVGSNMEGGSSAALPDWTISNNRIDIKGGDDGIYYYTGSNPADNYGNAAVHYGSMLIDNNIFNEDKDGGMDRAIDFLIEDVCEDCYESSTFSHGDITITSNTIYNAEDIGINVGYNSLESEAFAVVTLGTLDITGNTVKNITEEGIRFDISAINNDPSTAVLSIGKTTIADNTVTASAAPGVESAGIWIDGGGIGDGVVLAAPEVSNNTVTGFNVGIGMDDLSEATISCNSVKNSGQFGLFFLSDGTFTAVNNSLVDNGLGLKVEDGSTAAITAENNWWGDAAGPAACASCNGVDAGGGTVDYTPWLTSQPRCSWSTFPWIMFMPAITGMRP